MSETIIDIRPTYQGISVTTKGVSVTIQPSELSHLAHALNEAVCLWGCEEGKAAYEKRLRMERAVRKLRESLQGVTRILQAFASTTRLGPSQQKRLDAAIAALEEFET